MTQVTTKSGTRKSHRINLATARNGKEYKGLGKLLRVTDASSAAAVLSLAVQHNVPDGYETLRKNGKIIETEGFDRFFVTNEAQPGEWVRVVVSEGNYDVDNQSGQVIDSIVDTVTVDGTVSVTKATTGPTTVADVAIAATTTTIVLAASATRRKAIISNLQANGTVVRVGDASTGAARGAEIPIGGSAEIEATGAIYVYNPSGSGINIGVAYSAD